MINIISHKVVGPMIMMHGIDYIIVMTRDDGIEFSDILEFQKQPDKTTLDEAVATFLASKETLINTELTPEKNEAEIIAFLIEKELLLEGQTLQSLKSKAEILAEASVK